VKLTTHLHLVPRSKNEWSYTSTPQYAFMAWCSVKARTTLPFTFYSLGRRLRGPQSHSGPGGEEKNPRSCRKLNTGRLARSIITKLTELQRLVLSCSDFPENQACFSEVTRNIITCQVPVYMISFGPFFKLAPHAMKDSFTGSTPCF
jgi:hypothetical protein